MIDGTSKAPKFQVTTYPVSLFRSHKSLQITAKLGSWGAPWLRMNQPKELTTF